MVFVGMLMTFAASAEEKLKPFTSDGCSAFPDGTLFFSKSCGSSVARLTIWLTGVVAHLPSERQPMRNSRPVLRASVNRK